MSKVPKFTVVTPSLNQGNYISQTIESVLSQAGDFEIEYLVLDGGSTDESVEIIRRYATDINNGSWPVRCVGVSMIWQSQKDKGQSNAINLGLRQSTGNIVSYINSDDLYFPGAFDRIAKEYIGLDKWDLIFGDGDVIDENGDLQWEWLSRPYNHSVMTSYHFLLHGFSSRVTPTTAGFTNYIMQQATFWRREVMDKIGYFDESFHFAMDAEYWIRAGHSKLRIRHIPFKIGKFRWIKGTKTQSGPTVFWDNYLEIFRRYRGSRHLAIFLAFYYYNLAEHAMLDINRAIEQGKTVFIRWKTLNTDEQEILRTQAEKGIKLACFLVANELHICNRKEEAKRTWERGIHGNFWLILHPFSLWCLLKHVGGVRFGSFLTDTLERLVLYFHTILYDYRYIPQVKKTRLCKMWLRVFGNH